MRKKRIGLDFDGVLHSYTSGFTGIEPLDPPVPGAVAFVNWLVEQNYEIHIFTARLSQLSDLRKDNLEEHREAVRMWLVKWGFPVKDISSISGQKPAADVFIDDNGYRFDGDFLKVIDGINSGVLLKPWFEKTKGAISLRNEIDRLSSE